jgi:primosomal protein N' (replication factor Y) (superfamily II helicase)
MPQVLKVAVAAPIRHTFDYLAAQDTPSGRLNPGIRLSVPFGHGTRIAYLLEISDLPDVDRSRLKCVHEILDERPLLSSADLKLLRWASHYYHHPIGEVISTAFPVLLRQGKPAVIKGETTLRLTEQGKRIELDLLRRAPRQAALLTLLRAHPQGLGSTRLSELDWDWRAGARRLAEKGCLEIFDAPPPPDSWASGGHTAAPFSLNADQRAAVETVSAAFGRFTTFLLEGVTGSGKTEVYMQLIRKILGRGEQVMVLLPEIALTPQIEGRFRARFPEPTAVFHSGLSEAERLNGWLRIQQGEASILLGTRSAVFIPLRKPGLIILDEEHDASFKQQEGFRFSARDVAIVRGRQLGIPVLLGSATPSLESLLNVQKGRYRHLHLPQRAGTARHPRLQLLDIRNQKINEGLSPPLIAAMKQTLERKEQALLFLNRRGFAPTLICHACGWVAQCRRCDANLVIHSADHRLRCHHCGHQQSIPDSCSDCHASALRPLGLGTERVEQALECHFPDARLARVDRDSIKHKGELERFLLEIQSGGIDILLGTQLLAKGHHFPQVTLVGILDVDSGLFSTDFRSTERMAQIIVQVAGRAGREEKAGTVILQTRHPQHPLLCALIREGYGAFAVDALEERRAARLPPFSHQVLLRAHAADEAAPQQFLSKVCLLARKAATSPIDILGPVPAPMTRRAGRYRFQLLFQCPRREPLHALLDTIVPRLQTLPDNRRVRWSLDVDPVDLY